MLFKKHFLAFSKIASTAHLHLSSIKRLELFFLFFLVQFRSCDVRPVELFNHTPTY